MRSLVFLLVSTSASASVTRLMSTQVDSATRNGVLSWGDPASSSITSTSLSTRTAIRVEGLANQFTLEAAVAVSQPDYDSMTVRRRDGSVVALSTLDADPVDTTVEGAAVWARGPWTASVQALGPTTESLVRSTRGKAAVGRSFYNQATAVTLTMAAAKTTQPKSWFTLPDTFQTRASPTEISAQEVSVAVDQILTDSWKLRAALATTTRDTRPRAYRAELQQAWAFTDRFFARLDAMIARESRSPKLTDDRGYFTAAAAQATLNWEPAYDWLVSLSYGLGAEREDDPRSGALTQAASDQIAGAVRYDFGDVLTEARVGWIASNRDHDGWSAGGTLTWRF